MGKSQEEAKRAAADEAANAPVAEAPVAQATAAAEKPKATFGPFRVKRGYHIEGGKTYSQDDGWFMSRSNLVEKHGDEKFQGPESVDGPPPGMASLMPNPAAPPAQQE